MLRRVLISLVWVSSVPAGLHAQQRLPILDMHMHAGLFFEPAMGICIPWITQFPAWDTRRPWSEIAFEAMQKPPCKNPIWSATDARGALRQTLEQAEKYNVVGVLTGTADDVQQWVQAAPGRFIPALQFKIGRDSVSVDSMRALIGGGRLTMLGEITNQYVGIAPNDPRMDAYWALAQEMDIPVAIHMGDGIVGTAFLGIPEMADYRAALSNPYLLEDVLKKYPRLRVAVMHYAAPLVDELIAVLASYPQVYADIGGFQWYYPRPFFYEHLRKLVDAGFGHRVMFGSDQAQWPGVLGPAIKIIEEAPFLNEQQKRDIFYNNAARFLRLSPQEIARHHGR